MRDINRIILFGRLGTDPVLRHTKTGIPVSQFSLATEYYNRNKKEAETTWHRVITWGRPAELTSTELKKGMPVFIEGGIRVRRFQDDDGEVHYFHEVHAERVNFVHQKSKTMIEDTVEVTETPLIEDLAV